MLPTSSSSSRPASPRSDDAVGASESPQQEGGDALGPIGPERLAELREAIKNGTYPSESDVVGGLVRMFGDRDPS